ncbi:hypothetical protein P389DRAFT_165995 [Cystobasidium minutum MCA 4210]|uniref:uncharacterized protein n=1 Tax=Cystobasidium minutum MCA 4210 TaxID=1397322 RepID=UPI0034CD6952|eukprot:jgi/Rhomi1/165995/fgenesh1_kg.1_\
MHLPILDGSQGMCSSSNGVSTAGSSQSEPSPVSLSSMMRMDNSSSNTSKEGDNGKHTANSGVTSTLASWIAPSSSSPPSNNTSQRATSIPNPAGSSTSSSASKTTGGGGGLTLLQRDDEDSHHYITSDTQDHQSRPSLPSSSRRPPSTSTLSALLEPFNPAPNSSNRDTDGRIKIPSTARAGADIAEQKTASGVGLLESWKYLPFLAHQATKLASAFVSHHVFGPPKKSWGIELTLFTTAIRESVQYSHLSSLPTLRRFLNLGQILPVPKDGVVTPVTFHVLKRNLPGILADADAAEDGTRELTGEWVVSKRIWRRMQRDNYGHAHAQAPVHSPPASSSSRRKNSGSSSRLNERNSPTFSTHSRPQASHPSASASSSQASPPHSSKDKVILYLHGGAYYTMSAATHRYITISVSKYTNCRVFAVNYRLAPECRWPGQIHDAVSAYLRLIEDLKIPPEIILFAGDSAGGGLTLATIMYLRDNGFPLPCGAIVMSPWVDLTMSCDSWETNAPYDYLRMPSGDDHMNPIASLLGASNVKKLITHPYVSPLFGDFHDFPPLLIQCGDAECLRDEGTLLAHKASLAGVQVYHEVYEDCPHVFQAMFFLEASKKAFRSHRNFVKRILPTGLRNKEGRRQRVDMSEMDHEVMSDAHAIKADGQPEVASLPASPRAMRRELSSLTPVTSGKNEDSAMPPSDSAASARRTEEVAFLEEDGDLGYDDEEDESNPFNVESSGASATTSDRDASSAADEGEFEGLPPSLETRQEEGMAQDTPQDSIADMALNATSAMVKLGSAFSLSSHHDLDSVAEEQDESIEKIESSESNGRHDLAGEKSSKPSTSSLRIPRNGSAQRLHANQAYAPYQHQYQHYTQHRNHGNFSNSTTPAHSPSASFASLPHSSPSGSHTPLASQTPTSSAPPSPGISIRSSNRQRSFSSLSMASLTPSNTLYRNNSTASSPSTTTHALPRPGHSRSSSTVSVRTMRAGSFREISKPRARANSHPDLQALLDSYDAAGPAQHTIMWVNEEEEAAASVSEHERAPLDTALDNQSRRLSSDDSMEEDTFGI